MEYLKTKVDEKSIKVGGQAMIGDIGRICHTHHLQGWSGIHQDPWQA